MDISVIIVNFNTKKETSDCINSCLKEGSGLKTEIIVLDNASSDGSPAYLTEKFKNNKNVMILKNSYNDGFSKGVNIGLKISKGKYKYLLNSDTIVNKNTFKKLIDYSKDHPDIGVIGTKLILPDGSTQKSCFNFPGILYAIEEYWFGKKAKFSSFYKENTSEVDAVVGASFLITPKAYEKVGLFDERYFMYFEDIDYCKRVSNAGLKVIYLSDLTVFHYHGLSGNKLAVKNDQWRRLIPSSKIYHGVLKHYLINFILWTGQKFKLRI